MSECATKVKDAIHPIANEKHRPLSDGEYT